MGGEKIETFPQKYLKKMSHPFTPKSEPGLKYTDIIALFWLYPGLPENWTNKQTNK